LLEIDREGFLREDMLAGAERRERDAEMGARHREVDHEIDIIPGEELVHGEGFDAVPAGLSLGGFRPHVRAGPKGQALIGRDVLEIDA
jgi:hypothetical protein